MRLALKLNLFYSALQRAFGLQPVLESCDGDAHSRVFNPAHILAKLVQSHSRMPLSEVIRQTSIIPSLMPVVGLKELRLQASELGYLFTAMAVGSVVSGSFIIPWARAS